jgi:hypothetical protein
MKEPKNKLSISTFTLGDIIRKPTPSGAIIVLERTYYEEEGMTDLEKSPKKFWVFTRSFSLRVTPKGVPMLESKRDVIEIEGKSNDAMTQRLEAFTEKCYGRVPENVGSDWIPTDFLEVKRAIKSGAFKV